MLYSLALCLATVASALDHKNLDEGRPARLEDAHPIAKGELALEAGGGFARPRGGGPDRRVYQLEALYGLPRVQLGVGSVLFSRPRAPREGQESGDVKTSALFNLVKEAGAVPALSIKGEVYVPTGVRSEGMDYGIDGLLSKAFGAFGVHLNIGHAFTGRATGLERSNYHIMAGGVTLSLGRVTLVADYFQDHSELRGRHHIRGGDAGLRVQLAERVVWDAGVGREFTGDERSDFRVTTGLSVGLGL